ncbi:C40 family peptidase [Anaeroselena agilis]|uniref:C40 family peptidase n=1 Tax=Anaeroselena agilis TaxID=3063788 RepID=A0ABU3P2L0_9FIRM|nr:C40 family peptidase [Selenomonadales bacterium 4137-cl]
MKKALAAITVAAFMLAACPPAAGAAELAPVSRSAPAAAKPPPPSKTPTGRDIVATAQKYKGVPYRYGGATPKGFDCSGFVMFVYNQHGKKLPRSADQQYKAGKPGKPKDLALGDLVFFTTTEKGPSHVGIFVGGGKFIHASSSRGVVVTALGDAYWKPRYLGARTVL